MTTKTTPTTKTAAEATEAPGYYSHWIEFQRIGTDLAKEELFPSWVTAWRGQPAVVQMKMDRYSDSEGHVGGWRVVAGDARAYDPDDSGRYGAHLTDTARSRLRDALTPLAVEFLSSDRYHASRARALASAIERETEGHTANTRRASQLLAAYRDQMPTAIGDALAEVIVATDARDRAREALRTAVAAR